MKFGFPGGPRLEWYDRNPQQGNITYLGTDVAPHAAVPRATYTVPAGKKAKIMSITLQAVRKTSPTTIGVVSVVASSDSSFIARAILFNGTAGVDVRLQLGECGVLLAGQSLSLTTADNSTGGTVDYRLDMNYIEFDA